MSIEELKSNSIFGKLSDEALKIIFAPSDKRNIRVIAGAGAGKTEVLALRIIYLLLSGIAQPKEIVAFTFTDKAAESIQSRIYQRIQQFNYQELTNNLCEMYIGTIHGYCKRLLKDFYGKFNFEVLEDIKGKVFIHQMSEQLGLNKSIEVIEQKFDINLANIQKDRELNSKENHFKLYEKFSETYDIINNEEISLSDLAQPEFREITEIILKYEELLQDNHLITFGQLIKNAIMELERNPSPIKELRFLFVDEYQDINRAQEHLIRLLGQEYSGIKASSEIFVVGDPKQAVYHWRGSDLCCFKNFEKLIPGKLINSLKIHTNYRSLSSIVKFASQFSKNAGIDDFNHPQKTPRNTGEGLVIGMIFDSPQDEAKHIVSQIKNIVEKYDHLTYSDIAILLRSVKTTSKPFIEECQRQKIPYIIGGKMGLMSHPEITAIISLLMWLHEDGYWKKWNNLTRKVQIVANEELLTLGVDRWFSTCNKNKIEHPLYGRKNELKEILREWKQKALISMKHSITANHINVELSNSGIDEIPAELDLEAQKETKIRGSMPDTHEIIEKYNNYLVGLTYFDIFNDLLYCLGVRNLKLDNPFHATISANLGRLSQVLNDFEFVRKNKGKLFNLYDSLPHLNEFIYNFQNAISEQEERENKYLHAVHIFTINQAKGLEWPIVFVPSVVENRFPTTFLDQDPVNFLTINDRTKIPFDMERYKTKIKDEVRLFYVAVTRAKKVAVITRYTDPKIQQANQSALLHYFPNTIQKINKRTNIADHPSFPIVTASSKLNENEEMDEYSITEILDYAKCPSLYRYRHYLKFSSKMNRFLGYGHALHHILQKIVADDFLDLTNTQMVRQKLEKLMITDFRLPYLDEAVNNLIRKGANRLIMGYLSQYATELNTITSVETRLELVEKNAIIKGITDVILGNETGKKSQVWDYKTKRMDFEKINELQILLYSAALEDMGYSIDSGAIAYLKEKQNVPVEISQVALKQARNRVNTIVEKIRGRDFSNSMNLGDCTKIGCDQYKICPYSDYSDQTQDEKGKILKK
ncbi:ATP-dependent DNA helicase [Candidatus Lokiarchaeum ossiferum]|uniref:ATP-dependent DNA helicase n=1 Tax=Candidatus Lokiarchaeum ossiferum TaxID=2951803 RepID=UPI00352FAF1E